MDSVESITDGSLALERCGDLFRSDPAGCNTVASVLRPGAETKLTRFAHDARTTGAAVAWPPGTTVNRLAQTLDTMSPNRSLSRTDGCGEPLTTCSR